MTKPYEVDFTTIGIVVLKIMEFQTDLNLILGIPSGSLFKRMTFETSLKFLALRIQAGGPFLGETPNCPRFCFWAESPTYQLPMSWNIQHRLILILVTYRPTQHLWLYTRKLNRISSWIAIYLLTKESHFLQTSRCQILLDEDSVLL
jgi:hypothetical protein